MIELVPYHRTHWPMVAATLRDCDREEMDIVGLTERDVGRVLTGGLFPRTAYIDNEPVMVCAWRLDEALQRAWAWGYMFSTDAAWPAIARTVTREARAQIAMLKRCGLTDVLTQSNEAKHAAHAWLERCLGMRCIDAVDMVHVFHRRLA